MSTKGTVKDNRSQSSGNTFYNFIQLMIENQIRQKVNTSEMVKIVDVEPGGPGGAAGYVTVKPLVRQTDAKGESIEPVELYKLPYFRAQCGGAAIVMDPKPGDVGLASFTKRDSSGIKAGQSETVPPGSLRHFDQADGVFVGTMLNKAPETYVEMSPDDKRVTTHAPESAVVETKESTINADEKAVTNTKDFQANASQTAAIAAGVSASVKAGSSVGLKAPQVGISGNLSVSGEDGGSGTSTFRGDMIIIGNLRVQGNISVTGSISAGGDVVGGGISLMHHTHPGVDRGYANTDPPV